MSQNNIICPGNAWTVLRTGATRYDRDSDSEIVLSGVSPTWRISATSTGTAIHVALSGTLTESPVTDGTYDAEIDGDVTLARLADYDGENVYEIVEVRVGGVLYYRDVKVLRVSLERRV